MRSSARENLLDPVQLLAHPAITVGSKPPLDLGHQLPLQNVPEGLRDLPVVPLFLALACRLRLAGESDWKSLFEFIYQPLKRSSYGIFLIWRLWFFKGGFVPVRLGRFWVLGFLCLRFERDFIHKACRIFTG